MVDGPVLTPPPPRSAPFLQPRPELQGPKIPGSLQTPPTDDNKAGGMGGIAPPQTMSQNWSGWFRNLYNVMKPGVTKTVVIGGTTLVFKNGIFVGSSP